MVPTRSALSPLILLLLAILCAPPARASQPTSPAQHPALNSPSVDERIQQMDAPAANRDPVKPDGSQATPGAPLREGSFLVSRRGRLAQSHDGWWFFFDADESGHSDTPVLVHPCATLAGMIRLMESRREPTTFYLSAEVFADGGRNYVLPTHFSVAAARAEPTPAPPPVQAADDATSNTADPSAASLISGVERATSARRDAPVASASAASGPVVREGEFFNLRKARMMPDQSGQWRVTFDNDAESGKSDPPMTLLPCRTLGRMTNLARAAREGMTVTVSGRVFLFEGRNYLLPTLFFVDYAAAAGEIRAAQ